MRDTWHIVMLLILLFITVAGAFASQDVDLPRDDRNMARNTGLVCLALLIPGVLTLLLK